MPANAYLHDGALGEVEEAGGRREEVEEGGCGTTSTMVNVVDGCSGNLRNVGSASLSMFVEPQCNFKRLHDVFKYS